MPSRRRWTGATAERLEPAPDRKAAAGTDTKSVTVADIDVADDPDVAAIRTRDGATGWRVPMTIQDPSGTLDSVPDQKTSLVRRHEAGDPRGKAGYQ